MSIMSVQIQCKSSLNQGLTDKLKGWNPMEWGGGGGGKNTINQKMILKVNGLNP